MRVRLWRKRPAGAAAAPRESWPAPSTPASPSPVKETCAQITGDGRFHSGQDPRPTTPPVSNGCSGSAVLAPHGATMMRRPPCSWACGPPTGRCRRRNIPERRAQLSFHGGNMTGGELPRYPAAGQRRRRFPDRCRDWPKTPSPGHPNWPAISIFRLSRGLPHRPLFLATAYVRGAHPFRGEISRDFLLQLAAFGSAFPPLLQVATAHCTAAILVMQPCDTVRGIRKWRSPWRPKANGGECPIASLLRFLPK